MELLDAASHQSKREVERLLAERFPQPDVPDQVRRLPGMQAPLRLAATGAPAEVAPAQSSARPRTTSGSRHLPSDVRRAVWDRDGGQCAYVSADGCRCTEHGFLEYHHVVPFAAGGQHTVENVQLRCRMHDHYEAVLAFGADAMERARHGPRRRSGEPAAAVFRHEPAVHSALRNLGYSAAEARAALRECREQVAVEASIEELLRASLARAGRQKA